MPYIEFLVLQFDSDILIFDDPPIRAIPYLRLNYSSLKLNQFILFFYFLFFSPYIYFILFYLLLVPYITLFMKDDN